MTEPNQDVTFGVVTPSLPAVPVVRPGVRTSDCVAAGQALHVATDPTSVSTTSDSSTSVHSLTNANAPAAECPSSHHCLLPSSVSENCIQNQDTCSSNNIVEARLIDVDVSATSNKLNCNFGETRAKELTSNTLNPQNDSNRTFKDACANTDTDETSVKEIPYAKPREQYSIHSPVQDSEGNLSVSTDETLHNSDSDSLAYTNKECTTLRSVDKENTPFDFDNGDTVAESEMGNQQSDKKSRQSDDDTPDEAKTKCCEIPKKKVKDRYSKATTRSSKSGEEYDFEDDELYPFESRTRSEHEIVDPVELEPFEIIETDDIKFIPGAGTSDVIKSASESKFKTIPEEEGIDGDEKFDTFIIKHDKHDRPPDKEVVLINRGEVFLETGTSTAHSTFEFKPAKARPKATKKQPEEKPEPTYENVQAAVSSVSVSSSKTNSSSSSNDASRKNSKEGIQKPTRQKSKKRSDSASSDPDNKEKIEKSKKTKSKQPKEKETNEETKTGNKALILTQTMFSTPNPQEKGDKQKVLNESSIPQNTYQNVNVGVKFGPQGITICNTSPEYKTDPSEISKDKITPRGIQEECSAKPDSFLGLPNQSDNVGEQSPFYETLTPELKGENRTDTDIVNRNFTNREDTKSAINNRTKLGVIDSAVVLENVPPPSPLSLDILEEEDEEEEEEDIIDELDEQDLINEENKRKSEIIEFTENVCKRLSQLLEDQPPTHCDTIDSSIDHIYETVKKEELYAEILPKLPDRNVAGKTDVNNDDVNTDNALRRPVREDSSSTLKRTSGDSTTYQMTETLGSSDDDLPEYFDPKGAQLPKRDSEILCDVLDAYTEEGIAAVSAKEVADIVDSHTLEFGNYIQGHSTNKADRVFSLPVQKFDESLISKAPNTNSTEEIQERTPIAEIRPEFTALPELASAKEDAPVQYNTSGRQSVTYTESDLDISEHRDDLSTDSMLADDEDEETMEILFTKTYTEPVEGGEVFLSCTVVNSAYKDEHKKSETWLSDEALEYFEANAADVMSTAFMKAKKEMKDIQVCLQSLRKQMDHFHDVDDISLPDIPVDALSPTDYFGLPRKAVTD